MQLMLFGNSVYDTSGSMLFVSSKREITWPTGNTNRSSWIRCTHTHSATCPLCLHWTVHIPYFNDRDTDACRLPLIHQAIRGQATPASLVDGLFWAEEVRRGHVNTRAWVLQELLLSRRVLFFGERQVFWDCRSGRAAEIWLLNTPVEDSYEGPRIEDLQLDHGRTRGEAEDTRKAYDCWSNIVSTYTRCNITFPSDRMIALSAVAKEMKEVLGDDYIAGMWRRYLESELLWRVLTVPDSPSSLPKTYRAPSWSWAAADGAVIAGWPYTRNSPLIEVEDFHIEYVTGDKTGLISGGWLRLWGKLKPMKLFRYEGPRSRDNDHDGQVWNIVVNGLNTKEGQVQNVVELDMFHNNFDEQNNKSFLYCMPAKWHEVGVIDSETREVSGKMSMYELSLLLFELQDSEGQLFRRLGIARISVGSTKEDFVIQQEGESGYPC
ncbi:hypothetical protein BDP81DRAFT_492821, partial [Colletotrichum phormii]